MRVASSERRWHVGEFTNSWKCYAWYSFGVFQVVVLLIAMAKPANAYVDPGSGLLFLQVGGSMLAGALFAFRAKIRKLFRMEDKHTESTEDNHGPAGEAETGSHL